MSTQTTLHHPPFRQQCCLWPTCGVVFYICRCCERGQRYCSSHCSQKARHQHHRQANRRYQQSREGRLDHRDRQKVYRRKHLQNSVTDHTYAPSPSRATIKTEEDWINKHHPALSGRPSSPGNLSTSGHMVCHFCGRTGYFCNPFDSGG